MPESCSIADIHLSQLDRLISSEHQVICNRENKYLLQRGSFLMRNDHFKALHFQTDYKVCGEDVELSLDLREQQG